MINSKGSKIKILGPNLHTLFKNAHMGCLSDPGINFYLNSFTKYADTVKNSKFKKEKKRIKVKEMSFPSIFYVYFCFYIIFLHLERFLRDFIAYNSKFFHILCCFLSIFRPFHSTFGHIWNSRQLSSYSFLEENCLLEIRDSVQYGMKSNIHREIITSVKCPALFSNSSICFAYCH